MSRLLDFKDLRDKILAGEDDEEIMPEEDSPFKQELKEKMTAIPLCISAASFGMVMFDRWQNEGGMFEHYTPIVVVLGGFLPLGYALGRLNRGMVAQDETTRYGKLLDEAQTSLEDSEEETQAAEEKAKKAAENDYRLDYLSADTSMNTHLPSIGLGIGSFGQEGVLYRPSGDRHNNLF